MSSKQFVNAPSVHYVFSSRESMPFLFAAISNPAIRSFSCTHSTSLYSACFLKIHARETQPASSYLDLPFCSRDRLTGNRPPRSVPGRRLMDTLKTTSAHSPWIPRQSRTQEHPACCKPCPTRHMGHVSR